MTNIFDEADKWAEQYLQPARQVKTHPEWKQQALEYLKQFNIVESDFRDNSELYWFIKNRRTSFPTCPVTGQRTQYKDNGVYCTYSARAASKDANYIEKRKQNNFAKYGTTCSFKTEQAKQKTKETMLRKYGTEDYNHTPEAREKAKKTMLERYGVEHAIQNKDILQKRKQTNLKRYGVDEIGKSKELQQKARETSLERYGVEYAMQSKNVQDKYRDIIQEKYGYTSPFKFPEVNQTRVLRTKQQTWEKIQSYSKYVIPLFTFEELCKSKDNVFTWKDVATGEEFTSRYYYMMPKLLSHTDIELFVKEILEKYNITYEFRKHGLIGKKEIDFYIPSLNLGIEVGGLYWHSDVFCDSKYHIGKYNDAKSAGIKLIQIFSDEIVNHPQIVKKRIEHALNATSYKLYARNCEIREIDKSLKSKFLTKYHIQGNDSSSIRFGAFYRNRLVAVMTFGSQRKLMGGKAADGSYEMYRFCTIGNFNILGIASKLLTHFERTYNPKEVKTFADLRWGSGDLYEHLGFTLDHISKPNYWYVKSGKRFNRTAFQKHLLADKLEKFDPNKSETENMRDNGYLRIFDCGNAVYLKHYK